MMIILRARKALRITGGGLYVICYASFLDQMKAALSYIAALNTILAKHS
jgi:hypothetical protein